jgi:type I restriction enzyme, S subunit
MSELWYKIKVKDIGAILTGNTPPRKKTAYFNGKYPWIKPTDITIGNRYVDKTDETYSEIALKKYGKYLLPPESTCVVTIGTIGKKICLSKEPCFTNQSINAIVPNVEKYDPFFVYYLMKYHLPNVAQRNPGTASGRHHVSKTNLSNMYVEVPPLFVQKKIAQILTPFDDLYETNNEKMNILENLAHTIFAKWFFVYKQVNNNNPSSAIKENSPHTWITKSASEAIDISPKTKLPQKNKYKYIPMRSISTTSMIIEKYELVDKKSGSKFKNDDTLFARITPSLENGKTGFVQFLNDNEVGIGSTELIVLRSKSLTPEYVYLLSRTDEFRNNAIKSMQGGSGRQRVRNMCFDNFFFAHPPEKRLLNLTQMVRPIFKHVFDLSLENNILLELRDLLISSIFSGKINVSDLDIEE